MKKLNTVAKALGKPKGKIKDMCKNGEITFEVVKGIYYVDENEVKQKLEEIPSNRLIDLDKEMKYILKETLIDFKYSNVNSNHKNVRVLNKVLTDGFISDYDTLEYVIEYYSKIFMNVYNSNPTEFIKWFDVETPNDFYTLRNHYMNTKNTTLSVCFEHFYMFDKLTNGNFFSRILLRFTIFI